MFSFVLFFIFCIQSTLAHTLTPLLIIHDIIIYDIIFDFTLLFFIFSFLNFFFVGKYQTIPNASSPSLSSLKEERNDPQKGIAR